MPDNITFDVSFGSTIQKQPGSYEYDRIDFALRNIPLSATPEYLQQLAMEANPKMEIVFGGLIDRMHQILKEAYGR